MSTDKSKPFIHDQHKSLPYDLWTIEMEISAVDIHQMESMTESQYKEYIL